MLTLAGPARVEGRVALLAGATMIHHHPLYTAVADPRGSSVVVDLFQHGFESAVVFGAAPRVEHDAARPPAP